jgi:hypothetical protein
MRLLLPLLLALAACDAPKPPPAAQPQPQPVSAPATIRVCRDAAGHRAECREDPVVPRECVAGDRYGRCPGDPRCFDAKDQQIECVIPVNWVTIPTSEKPYPGS